MTRLTTVLASISLSLAVAATAAAEVAPGLCAPVRDGIAIDLLGAQFTQGQARDPREDAAQIDVRQSMILLPGGRFLVRTSSLHDRGLEFRLRTVGGPDGEKTIDELGWRYGDAVLSDAALNSARNYADLALLAPAFLACQPGQALDDGSGRTRISDPAGRIVDLRLADGSPEITEANAAGAVYRYEDWRSVAGVRQPGRITVTYGDKVAMRWSAATARPKQANDERLMTIPSGHAPPPDPGPLRAVSLGAGAFTTEGGATGYHTGFVVGDRVVAVFDAPLSPEVARAFRAVIEGAAPGKPIAYVVVSHVHGDHIAGLAAYPDAEIVTGPGGWSAIERSLGKAAPSRHREIVAATVLDLGGRTLRLYPFDSIHSKTMIVAFAPKSGTIFQGDLFYRPERLPKLAAFETGAELNDVIAKEKLDVKAIVGVHGIMATMWNLRQALALPRGRNDRGCIGHALTSPRSC